MPTFQLFRKKPVVIEAALFDGTVERGDAISQWAALFGVGILVQTLDACTTLHVETLEGTMQASKGDFIIRGVRDEFYPCKPDIFNATYDPIQEPA